MRAFLAVEPEDEAVSALRDLLDKLQPHKGWLRPVRKEQLHLTLRFFKDIPESKAADMREALSSTSFKGFQSALQGIGCFPRWKRPRVLWAGCSNKEQWNALHNRISQELAALGFPKDRRFTPHITLARVKRRPEPGQLENVRALEVPHTAFEVSEVLLKKSVLTPQGAQHSTLWKMALD